MPDSVRIDKWLWVARFFKTRSLAAQAVACNPVQHGQKDDLRGKWLGHSLACSGFGGNDLLLAMMTNCMDVEL